MESYRSGSATVLVIDDDPGIRSCIARALRKAGHACVDAVGGDEGLRAARRARPDAIVLDIGLPDQDGRDVLQQIRSDPAIADVPVVVISGDIDQYRRMEALEAGAEDVVEKPFDPVLLERKLSWIVTKKRACANN